MTLRNALNTGVSGLITEGRALGVVGDNVANLNTVGFKQSRAIFEDVLGGAVGGGNAPGFGVRMARTQQIFAQGHQRGVLGAELVRAKIKDELPAYQRTGQPSSVGGFLIDNHLVPGLRQLAGAGQAGDSST